MDRKLNIVCYKNLFWAVKEHLKSLVPHLQQKCGLKSNYIALSKTHKFKSLENVFSM